MSPAGAQYERALGRLQQRQVEHFLALDIEGWQTLCELEVRMRRAADEETREDTPPDVTHHGVNQESTGGTP
jgi:hypothetical protein